MKRRAEFWVRKRDGRREWLRANKLGRSIQRAVEAATAGDLAVEDWWAMELTAAVLQGLAKNQGQGEVLTTSRLARAVEQVLLAMGFPQAAEAYHRAGADQRHRRRILVRRRLISGAAVDPDAGKLSGCTGQRGEAASGHGPFPRV